MNWFMEIGWVMIGKREVGSLVLISLWQSGIWRRPIIS